MTNRSNKVKKTGLYYKRIIHVILMGFFAWFFVRLLIAILDIGGSSDLYYNLVTKPLCEGKWYLFITWFYPYLQDPFIYLTIGLIIGLIIGIKKGGKSIFLYPIIFVAIAGIVILILNTLLCSISGGGYDDCVNIPGLTIIFTIFYILISLLPSVVFYYKKEKVILIFLFIIIILLLTSGIIIGIFLTNKCLKDTQELPDFEKTIEETIPLMKEKAIAENNIEVCGEMIDFYKNQREKIPEYLRIVPHGEYPPGFYILSNNYLECVEQIALNSKDESLCEKVDLIYSYRSSLDGADMSFSRNIDYSECLKKVQESQQS